LYEPCDVSFFRSFRDVSTSKEEESVPQALKDVVGDSLGDFCLRKVAHRFFRDERREYPIPRTPVEREEAVRCLGVLALRVCRRSCSVGPRSKLEALRMPAMKVRVIGVPDALTFVEGTWIRKSAHLVAPSHWMLRTDDPGCPPPGLHDQCAAGETLVSLDLSNATDGLSHRAVEAIIDGFLDAGVIRPTDSVYAKRSLGLVPRTLWHRSGGHLPTDRWYAERGSPMGTPLSFPVLSWATEWLTRSFGSVASHGDDAVGRDLGSFGTEVYADGAISLGADLNRSKTFISNFGWTMCEVMGVPHARGDGMAVFCPPPVPQIATGLPVAADPRLGRRYLKRAERVQRTFFPRFRLRLTLPCEFGGYGYTGRGLVAPAAIRKRLAVLVSRGLNPSEAERWLGKVPFQEGGLFPKPLAQRVGRPGAFYRLRKVLPTIKDILDSRGSERRLLSDVVASVEAQHESFYRMTAGYDDGRKIVRAAHGKTRRTKPQTLFRGVMCKSIRPLTRSHGLVSLRRLSEGFANTPVGIRDDFAGMIRGRTTR
jgi:hypothetical protein